MRRNVIFSFAVSITFSLATTVVAGQCNDVLITNKDELSKSFDLQIAHMMTIDKSKFEKIKTGTGGSLTVPDLISASANYEKFEERRSKYLESVSSSNIESNAFDLVRNSLDPEAINAWKACMAGKDASGILLTAGERTKTAALLKVLWNPGNGVVGKRKFDLAVDGQYLKSYVWTHPDEASEVISLSGEAAIITINGPGFSDELVLFPYDDRNWIDIARAEIAEYLELKDGGGISLGYHSRSSADCASGYATPAPANLAEGFCKTVDNDCSWPGSAGAKFGDVRTLAGRTFECVKGGERQEWK